MQQKMGIILKSKNKRPQKVNEQFHIRKYVRKSYKTR